MKLRVYGTDDFCMVQYVRTDNGISNELRNGRLEHSGVEFHRFNPATFQPMKYLKDWAHKGQCISGPIRGCTAQLFPNHPCRCNPNTTPIHSSSTTDPDPSR